MHSGLLLMVVGVVGFWSLMGPVRDSSLRAIVVIPEGAPLSRVTSLLHEEGIIRNAWVFTWLAKLSGAERKIISGEYEFHGGMTAWDVLTKLVRGQVLQHTITIPEGATIADIATILDAHRIVPREEFIEATRNADLIKQAGFEVQHLEGYLFPDTYSLSRPMAADAVVRLLVNRMKQVFSPELLGRAQELGMSIHQVLTLASVIEKETGRPEERDLISGVFHNRLRQHIPLQSDPTVIYALTGFDGNLRKKDLSIDSPYNTYRVRGLPPGPIASPGEASIRAALYPVPTHFLYFVSRNDGSHKFSATLAEHNSAVREYQLHRPLSPS